MRRTIFGFVFVLCVAASAQAVTLRDIIDLTKAGLGDEVMLALIEVDAGVFNIDTETLTQLKQAGVSQRVIVALVRSGRVKPAPVENPSAPVAMAPPEPIVVYVEQPAPAPVIQQVAVPVPVYVTVPTQRHGGHRSRPAEIPQPTASGHASTHGAPHYVTDVPPPPRKAEPVYWGFGGKLRPDAWKPK